MITERAFWELLKKGGDIYDLAAWEWLLKDSTTTMTVTWTNE